MTIPTLAAQDFAAFFKEIHGVPPFPWQMRLAAALAEGQSWPELIDLPTGAGKTAVIDIAVFHLALEAERGAERRAPLRVVFLVNRRLIVDDAHERAKKIAAALANPSVDSVANSVSQRLKNFVGDDGQPLLAVRLRGGLPREDDWARSPVQPTVLCSTIDQAGSRLLFRGYGVSNRMKSLHAGLLGSDCLLLLDEAHLAAPFQQTLGWIRQYRSEKWSDPRLSSPSPFAIVELTATASVTAESPFRLEQADLDNSVIAKRCAAAKPARLVLVMKPAAIHKAEPDEVVDDAPLASQEKIAGALVAEACSLRDRLVRQGLKAPVLGVVVNRVMLAREVFQTLKSEFGGSCELLIGPARPADREAVVDALSSIRTGVTPRPDGPFVIVATQCIEAGVDIDLDGLVSEAAPLDALRQRFGRLNRGGRDILAQASIVASRIHLAGRHVDPIYGTAIRATWQYLNKIAEPSEADNGEPRIDFGIAAMEAKLPKTLEQMAPFLAPHGYAPVLMPAHLDLFAQTSPVPAADPEVALYLHGPQLEPDTVSLIWRADVLPSNANEDVSRLLSLVPPRAAEAINLPVWAARAWLQQEPSERAKLIVLSDTSQAAPELSTSGSRRVFRWTGEERGAESISGSKIRPGDTIVIPAAYGGVDQYGWAPMNKSQAVDIADQAAQHYDGRRFFVRVCPELVAATTECQAGEAEWAFIDRRESALQNARKKLSDDLSDAATLSWRQLSERIGTSMMSASIRGRLDRLDFARRDKIEIFLDAYGTDAEGQPNGVVFVAPLGLRGASSIAVDAWATTDDDTAGSMPGVAQLLVEHAAEVVEQVKNFASRAGLPPKLAADLELAALLHDNGKADPRFQALLCWSDPLGPDPARILAKSERQAPRRARENSSDLPPLWRHEALSVRLAQHHRDFAKASDPALVLWLIGTHHGYGRPLYPHEDPHEADFSKEIEETFGGPLPAGVGPQSLAFNYEGRDWPGLQRMLQARYGLWELARLEATLRLADHRASEALQVRA